MQLLLAALIFGLIWFGIKKMAVANPANLKTNLRKVAGVAAIGLSIILTLKGGLVIAAPIFVVGLGLLGLEHLAGVQLPWSKSSGGQTSSMTSKMLSVVLDKKTGQIDGEVLAGRFAGQQLGSLSLEDLLKLLDECVEVGDQSPQLLQAYLDNRHPDWRAGVSGGKHKRASASSSGKMTNKEALAILGLEAGATKRKIISAHRNLMKKFHPDQGGSDYLATKINEAKDVLL